MGKSVEGLTLPCAKSRKWVFWFVLTNRCLARTPLSISHTKFEITFLGLKVKQFIANSQTNIFL